MNVPVRLVDTLEIHKLEHDTETLLIHLSTDNVYNGSQAYYKEDSPLEPVNCYGITKKDAELLIRVLFSACPSHEILSQGPVPLLSIGKKFSC